MRKQGVDLEEASTWARQPRNRDHADLLPVGAGLSHQLPSGSGTFVREINNYTRQWDLLRPNCVKPDDVVKYAMDLRSNCVQNAPQSGSNGDDKPLK